jgi:hypothetical protein
MRTYSSFLLFEDVLDFAPVNNGTIHQFIDRFTKPRVQIIEEDCLTKIGKSVEINYEIEGLHELATDAVIDKARIETLLGQGIYNVAVRNLFSCVTKTGICRKCYGGTYIDTTTPAVNVYTTLQPEYNYQTDVIITDGASTKFDLSQSSSDYTKVLIIINGVIQTVGYSITGSVLTMTVAPANGTHVVIKFYTVTSQPFVGFLAQTYTGALLGLQPLQTETLNIRPSLLQSLLTDEEIEIVKEELINKYKVITRNYVDYIDSVEDKLEKSIYLGMLYGLYSNVTS